MRTLPEIIQPKLRAAQLFIKDIRCWLLGHKPKQGPLKRSLNTVYTHWADTDCARCGKYLHSEMFYIDALSKPEYFQPGYEKLLPPESDHA